MSPLAAFGDPGAGTTVTPTVAHVGTADNVVPAEARVRVDVRVTNASEKERVEALMSGLRPVLGGAELEVKGDIGRPPMPESASATLFPIAVEVSPGIAGVAVGGGSDGNFTAALGVPTLDGLGAVGGGAHADHEWVDVTAMPGRTEFLAALVEAITTGG